MEPIPSVTSASSARATSPSELLTSHLSKRRTKKNVTNYIEKEVKPNCVFNYEEQLHIVHLIAMYSSDKYIQNMILEKFGKEVTIPQVKHYRTYPAWKPKIEEFRKEFESKIQDEEFASKRIRVQELSKFYRRLETDDKTIMDAATILDQIREEVEGKTSGGTNVTQYNQYNGLSDDELRKVIVENTRFLEIAEKTKTIEVSLETPDV